MGYIGVQPAKGQYRKLTDISSGFNGTATSFQLSVPPGGVNYYIIPSSPQQLMVSVGGIIQNPGVDYTTTGSQIIFTTAPAAGLSFFGTFLGDVGNGVSASGVDYIATGAGAVTRTTASKLGDIVSVKDFVSVVDGATDNTAGIQAAINASFGKTLYFPHGVYAVYGQLNINTDSVKIVGAGSGIAIVRQYTTNSNTFVFAPPTAGTTSAYQNNVGIEGLTVSYQTVGTTTGAGVKFIQCNNYYLKDLTINNAPEGIVIQGGQLGSLSNFQCYASNAMTPATGTGLLHFRQAPVGAGFEPCYTVEVTDFRISTNKKRWSGVVISNADGLHFTNGYIAFGSNSLVAVKPEQDNSYVAGVAFANVYMDCVSATGTLYGIHIPDSGYANFNVYGFQVGSGCTIGNALQAGGVGILLREPNLRDFSVLGTEIINIDQWGIDCGTGGFSTRLMVSSSRFSGIGYGGGAGAIRLASGGDSFAITNNRFSSITNVVLSPAGNWDAGLVAGNYNDSTAPDMNDAATYAKELMLAGNSSGNTATSTNWKGFTPGNVNSTDPKVLDHYLEGTFTPTLTFGGGSTGLTYTAQLGTYTRIGRMVFVTIAIDLSAKGSSTGDALISGLPFTVHQSYSTPLGLRTSGMINDVGATYLSASVLANSSTAAIYKIDNSGGTEVIVQLTDADFSSAASIRINGTYEIKA